MVAVAAVLLGATRGRERPVGVPGPPIGSAADLPAVLQAGHVLFRNAGFGDTYGSVSVAPLALPDAPRIPTDLRCERLHVEAGTGVCLQSHGGLFTTYSAVVFDAADPAFPLGPSLPLTGIPSRVKLSPDAAMAAITVFESGHSYAGGAFSTRTVIIGTATAAIIVDLDWFDVWRDGSRIRAEDLNMWGVTFDGTDGHFYATMSHAGAVYLVDGDLRTRRLEVIRTNVECPSISPDGTRLAFKQRQPPPDGAIPGTTLVTWRFAVLDLATMTETVLSEVASVDDQIEWLDDEHVLYGKYDETRAVTDTWLMAADGSGAPRRWIVEAESPTVVIHEFAAAYAAD
jgi:hypothetical protein